MISIPFPNREPLIIEHLVCDVNGTLALDGNLIEGVAEVIARLSQQVQVHLVTANTHGRQGEIDARLGVHAEVLTPGQEAEQKAAYVRRLGAGSVAALGQGANDRLMLSEAAVGIAVMCAEGLAVPTLLAADLVVSDTLSGLELLEHPLRITATLRT